MILPKKKYVMDHEIYTYRNSKKEIEVLDSEGMKQLADEMFKLWKGWEFKGEKAKITKMQNEYLELIKFLRGE